MKREPLHAVQTLRESLRDRERAALGKLLSEDQEIANRLATIQSNQAEQQAELAELSRAGRIDVRATSTRRYYLSQLKADAFMLNAAREELAREIAAQRKKLADADAAVKAVEKLLATKAERARIEAERKDQLLIEDQWAASHAVD